jgi:hypothetical protein
LGTQQEEALQLVRHQWDNKGYEIASNVLNIDNNARELGLSDLYRVYAIITAAFDHLQAEPNHLKVDEEPASLPSRAPRRICPVRSISPIRSDIAGLAGRSSQVIPYVNSQMIGMNQVDTNGYAIHYPQLEQDISGVGTFSDFLHLVPLDQLDNALIVS